MLVGKERHDVGRPAEELYHVVNAPRCIDNLADKQEYQNIKQNLIDLMTYELKAQEDPSILGYRDLFMTYPYAQEAHRDFYNRFMAGEPLRAGWIEQTDIENEPLD